MTVTLCHQDRVSGVDVVFPSALRRLDRVIQRRCSARHGIASPPHAVQTALLCGTLLVQFVVDSIGHARAVVPIAVVDQNEPCPLGERHRQITHVTAMLDLHGQGLVVDRLAAHCSEEIRQRCLNTGLRFIIPEDLQGQVRDRGDIEVGDLAGTFQVGQHHFLAFGHDRRVVLDMRPGHSVTDAVPIATFLGSARGNNKKAQHRRDHNCDNRPEFQHSRTSLIMKQTIQVTGVGFAALWVFCTTCSG